MSTRISTRLGDLAREVYLTALSKGFHDEEYGISDTHIYKTGVRIALIHDELSEALRELREPSVDYDKVGEELADVIIRTLDLAETLGVDIELSVVNKMEKNLYRPHKHGKVF